MKVRSAPHAELARFCEPRFACRQQKNGCYVRMGVVKAGPGKEEAKPKLLSVERLGDIHAVVTDNSVDVDSVQRAACQRLGHLRSSGM